MIENFFSPDVVKNNAVEESTAALRKLNAQVVVETKITDTRNQVDTQTYDATADFKNPAKFSKSREKYEWIDPAEIRKRYKEAQRVIGLLGGLEGAKLDAKAQAESITIEHLTDLIKKLEEVRQQYDKFDSRGGSEATEEDDIANSNGEKKFSDIQDQVYDIIIKLKKYRAKKEITDAKANGVVTDYTKIAENTKLAEVIDNLHITFEKDEDGLIGVYVNGEYANFDIVDPEECESYEIFPDAQKIGVLFVVKLKDGSILYVKFNLKGNTVFVFSKWDNETEWEQSKKTYKISN